METKTADALKQKEDRKSLISYFFTKKDSLKEFCNNDRIAQIMLPQSSIIHRNTNLFCNIINCKHTLRGTNAADALKNKEILKR